MKLYAICLLVCCSLSSSFYLASKKLSNAKVCMTIKNGDVPQQTKGLFAKLAVSVATVLSCSQIALAKPEGVNKPELLPKEQTSVIDVANFLSKGQEKKIVASIAELEKNTGYKLRILCQSYPNTPGLAIKEYWGVDDKTVVLVADRGEGFNRKGIPSNLINLNIGKTVELELSPQFWTRVGNKLGNTFYVKKNGEDIAVFNAVQAITFCLQDKECKDIPFDIGNQVY